MVDFPLPTIDDLLDRFDEFDDDSISDQMIQNAIELAATFVNSTDWTLTDYTLGIIYLAAHFLEVYNQQSSAGVSDMFVRSIGFGDRRVVFDSKAMEQTISAAASDFSTTMYGQFFQTLLRRNVAPIMII